MNRTFALALLLLSIMMTGGTYAEAGDAKVNYISAFAAHTKYKNDNAILIDVMPVVDYEKFHAVGAINLPNDGPADIERIKQMELPFTKKDEIIVYCS
ncbi:hypothetical protein GeomeDRAFT_1555 [Geobacter metallireducens RCH3]|nr:rhodanese-like domain-containing protein [Geobacter metallireducens]EHP86988.1 hypothetical protein GeomeDRAFT_1555 [Geobacter metallireducens RCH3]